MALRARLRRPSSGSSLIPSSFEHFRARVLCMILARGIVILVDAMAEAHQAETGRSCPSPWRCISGCSRPAPISPQHLQRRLVGAAMGREPQRQSDWPAAMQAKGFGAGGSGEAHGRGRGVSARGSGVQDKDAVERPAPRTAFTLYSSHGDREAHAQEIGGIIELVSFG